MRIVFAGTPDFAAQHLQQLLDDSHQVVAVYTQPDRPAGRGKRPQPSAVKKLAIEHQLPVYQPESLKSGDAQSDLAALEPDVMVVVAYGLLLPQAVLDIPARGCLNVHGSLLPRWRGAAPIQRAIWAGDLESGVCIMQMEAGLDTGPVLHEQRCTISPDETSASLYHKLEDLGPKALTKVLADLDTYQNQAQRQSDAEATYAKKLTKQEGEIDWTQPAAFIERCVRAFNPWPMSWCQSDNLKAQQNTIKIHAAELVQGASNEKPGTIIRSTQEGIDVVTGDGVLRITSAQMPGKKAQPASTLVNGYSNVFGQGLELE
ncbi:methionyl-tRNA formyltransferase [Idiomarina sp. HP20-50]|uniref:methionyl-tRNA formyltransferase n=1 Tax=Idiomarina sp. HP20-50 TaxID=3070813 RepID=UPI00294B7078|nr:methionyl-tRNA formyltransferase [Idiomarina sp. HP20-50]MDV6316492.1 methionyl-tRNA formyltransferase [Idiomarina sp. HP20-50]